MFNCLLDSLKENRYVMLYTNFEDTRKFSFCKILSLSEKELAVGMISLDGDEDGVSILCVDSIFRVEWEGQYSKKMEKLCAGKKLFTDIQFPNDDIMVFALKTATYSKNIVSIELLDSGFDDAVGFVDSIDDGECLVKLIDEYGFADGYSRILIKNITRVTYGSAEEKRVFKLWENNY